MSRETRDQLESSRARFHARASRAERSERDLFRRLRLLENAVRTHATGGCDCENPSLCLLSLYRRVPAKPRKAKR